MWNPLYNAITAQSESGNRDYDKLGRPIRSPAGAMYAMQTMPGTARSPGFGVRPAADNSPEEYNRVGRDYRDAMFRRYDNDPAKGWAAYNWGPGNLDKALSRYGDSWLDHAPAETRAYVQKNVSQLGGQMPAKPRTLADLQLSTTQDQPLGISQLPALTQGMTLADMTQDTGLAPHKKKLFGEGGKGWAALGIIGDALQTMRGGQATFAPFMQAQAQDMRAEQFNREKFAQTLALKREEAMRKASEPPSFVQDALWLAAHPEAKTPVAQMYDVRSPTLADYVDPQGNTRKGVYSREQGGFVGMGSAPPAEAIAELQADPSAAEEFDAIFGPGAAARYLGR